MSEKGVTKAEIFDAADALADLGIMPSILGVREAIGDRGSETTINKYLKEWKAILLKKNATGCIFCESTAKENKILTDKLTTHVIVVDQLKDALKAMIENPDRTIAIQEVIMRLQ